MKAQTTGLFLPISSAFPPHFHKCNRICLSLTKMVIFHLALYYWLILISLSLSSARENLLLRFILAPFRLFASSCWRHIHTVIIIIIQQLHAYWMTRWIRKETKEKMYKKRPCKQCEKMRKMFHFHKIFIILIHLSSPIGFETDRLYRKLNVITDDIKIRGVQKWNIAWICWNLAEKLSHNLIEAKEKKW